MFPRVPRTTDFLVIGGGVIGLTAALEVKRRWPDQSVLLIDKEPGLGRHASGRNSGVLHAGFYYTADSLKARFCRDGNRELTAYCQERGLRINRCGKLVVAKGTEDLAGLDELSRRAEVNGVRLESVTAGEAGRIEPRVRTHERALWSPTTATIDPAEVMAALGEDARASGIEVLLGTEYVGRKDGRAERRNDKTAGGREDRSPFPASRSAAQSIETSRGLVEAGSVVNCAGLYADRVARDFGFSERYRILPFKGLYLYGADDERLNVHVYPVPDLDNPFLGVHFTVTVDGHVKIGPTAMPAFWREQYEGLGNFRLGELADVMWREAGLFLRNEFGFRRLAVRELAKRSRRQITGLAAALVSGVTAQRYRRWGAPGIRAQLFDLTTRRLEMDFRCEGDHRSFHVLNAVSPAFTCAMPFARYVGDRIARLQG
jgi:L-2-hydroxyglutarate oxidase LhgO